MKHKPLVECVTDFAKLQKTWGFGYPRKGEILTVRQVEMHPAIQGLILLYFDERPNLPGLCMVDIFGKPNFVRVELPDNFLKELETIEQLIS